MTDKHISTRGRDIDSELNRRALSELLGVEAERSSLVAGFRQKILGGQLLRPAAIADWINGQHEQDWTPDAVKRASRSTEAKEVRFGREGIQPVFPGGVLDRLRHISEHLARAYGWDLGSATDFVLAGTVPSVPSLTVMWTEHYRYARLSRITLVVDPSVGPREVMLRYRAARARLIDRRIRRIGTKSSQLVLFHLEQKAKRPDITWRAEMDLWNKKYSKRPDFRFQQITNYAKRFSEARNNLLMVSAKESK